MLAAASDAVILGFNVRPVGDARQVADREGVEIRTYAVIYKALDDLRDAMSGMLEPEEVEDTARHAPRSAQIFKASKIGTIAGCHVTDGKITPRREGPPRARRHGHLRRRRSTRCAASRTTCARSPQGFECGIVLANFQDVKEGDVLEVYETRQVERELEKAR